MKEINKILFIDTETGGLDPRCYDLLSIGYLLYDINEDKVLDKGELYLKKNTGYKIDYNALAVNKFDFELIKNYGMEMLEIRTKILSLIDNSDCIAGYCVQFDKNFLEHSLDWEIKKPIFDVYSSVIQNELKSYKLTEICELKGIDFTNKPHNAIADVEATFELFKIYRK